MRLYATFGGRRRFWFSLWLVWIALIASPFMLYSMAQGLAGLSRDLTGLSRFFDRGDRLATAAIFTHMIAGGLITVMAPLQLVPVLRRRWPRLHRLSGRVIVMSALLTGVAGLIYILRQGTIGGQLMSVGFAFYGGLMLLAAAQVWRHARAGRFGTHQEWALRLFVLAMGSWLYRVHYGVWEAVTGGLGATPAFDGPFDKVQIFAFYLPYLVLLELLIRWRRRRHQRVGRQSVG